jgi:hypothetical protein
MGKWLRKRIKTAPSYRLGLTICAAQLRRACGFVLQSGTAMIGHILAKGDAVLVHTNHVAHKFTDAATCGVGVSAQGLAMSSGSQMVSASVRLKDI